MLLCFSCNAECLRISGVSVLFFCSGIDMNDQSGCLTSWLNQVFVCPLLVLGLEIATFVGALEEGNLDKAMHQIVCCLLFVVCCLLFVVCCLLFVVCGLLFVVCGLLFVGCCLLFFKWLTCVECQDSFPDRSAHFLRFWFSHVLNGSVKFGTRESVNLESGKIWNAGKCQFRTVC